MIKWFIDNLKPPYYKKMISAQVTHFASLILIGKRIDVGIRSKKIVDLEALNSMIEQQVEKATDHKGKETDVHMIDKALEGLRGVVSAYTAPNARPYQQQVQPVQAPFQAFNQRRSPGPPQYPKVEPRKLPPLPMPMAELYAYLLEKKLVTPKFTKPKDDPPLPEFDPFKKCKHHFGAEGHTLEKCINWRHRIQDLHRQQVSTV